MSPKLLLALPIVPFVDGPGADIGSPDIGRPTNGSLAAHGLGTVESGRGGRLAQNSPRASPAASVASGESAYRANTAAPPRRTAATRDQAPAVASTESASAVDENSGPTDAVTVVPSGRERPRLPVRAHTAGSDTKPTTKAAGDGDASAAGDAAFGTKPVGIAAVHETTGARRRVQIHVARACQPPRTCDGLGVGRAGGVVVLLFVLLRLVRRPMGRGACTAGPRGGGPRSPRGQTRNTGATGRTGMKARGARGVQPTRKCARARGGGGSGCVCYTVTDLLVVSRVHKRHGVPVEHRHRRRTSGVPVDTLVVRGAVRLAIRLAEEERPHPVHLRRTRSGWFPDEVPWLLLGMEGRRG